MNERNRALLEDHFRSDVTDRALDLAAARLARATVKVEGGSATVELPDRTLAEFDEDEFAIPVKKLRNVDGVWKLDAEMGEEDFFEKGGWGRLFRNSMKMMNLTAEKVTTGEFRTIDELQTYLQARQKEIEQEYEKELIEASQERSTRPANGKKE